MKYLLHQTQMSFWFIISVIGYKFRPQKTINFMRSHSLQVGRDSLVGIATAYELDGPGIESPINDPLAAINLTETNRCNTCEAIDTTQHRLTQCGESKLIWNFTRERIAAITRTNSLYVPETWTLRPDCLIWPPPTSVKKLSCGC